jgi:hypothetical protein
MPESSSTSKDSYAEGPVICIHCGSKATRRGKVSISDDLFHIRIRYHCVATGCGREADSVYQFVTWDEPEERKYGAI